MSQEIMELKKRLARVEKELKNHKNFIDTLMSYRLFCRTLLWMSILTKWKSKKVISHPKKNDRLKGKINTE